MSLFSCPCIEAKTNSITLTLPCFISDLHLNTEVTGQAAFFRRFLDEVAVHYEELLILGDFFDYWVGDDAWESASAILEPLRAFGKEKKLFLMHGNRDFMMGASLARRLNATLLTDPTVAQMGNQKVLLSHGDLWCINDEDYQKVRLKVRSFWWQWMVLRLPLKKRLSIAHNARARSKESKIKKEALAMDVDSKAVLDDALRLGCDAVIHGHTHRPGTYRLNDTINRYVLADWDFRASNAYRGGYLTIVNQQIETHSFC